MKIAASNTINFRNLVTKNNLLVFENNVVYETWKKEIALWHEVTDIDKKKQAVTIYFALEKNARNA